MNGAMKIVAFLEAQQIDVIFGYPGGSIMPFYDALIDSDIKHVLCRHEQGAALAADGYARASGRVGVCVATSGPGATNLITGLANAHMDSIPLIAITGQVPLAMIGTDAFQEIDVLGLSLAVTKASFLVERIDDLEAILEEALHIATAGRPGPVLIDIPKDIQLTRAPASDARVVAHERDIDSEIDELRIAQAKELIATSRHPLVYSGGGVSMASAVSEFRNFVETSGIPVVTTLKGIGNLPTDHPLCLGMLGMHGSESANHAVQNADLLICVGARFDDRATGNLVGFAPNAKVIQIDCDAAEIGKLRQVDAAFLGDMRPLLRQLTQPLAIDQWQALCCANRDADRSTEFDANGQSIDAPALLRELTSLTETEAVISCDVGQHQMWVAQHCRFQSPRNHLSSGGLGTMGYGLPAAIGAQFAKPNSQIINVAGDGSFMMNVQELATLNRYDLPVKIIILDNQRLGMVRQQQELFYQERYHSVDLSDNPDFVRVAQAFDIPAQHISRAKEVSSALENLLAEKGAALLHVRLNSDANVWPIVPPGATNSQMLKRRMS